MFSLCLPIGWSSVFVAVVIEHISIRPASPAVGFNALNLYYFAWSHSWGLDLFGARSSPLLIP